MAGSNAASGSHCQIYPERDMNRPKCNKPAPAIASKAWSAPAASAPGLLSRIKKLVLNPKSEWAVIAAEPTTIAELYAGYVTPIALLTALVGFLRMPMPGIDLAFGASLHMPILSGLAFTLMLFVSAVFGVSIVGLIINVLAPTFAGHRDLRQALKVAAYSLTPASLGSVLALAPIPATLLQLCAGIYGIYVLYLGLPVLMRSPQKAFGYSASVVICTVLMGVVFAVLSTVYPGGAVYAQPK
jgi:Yip1 domain